MPSLQCGVSAADARVTNLHHQTCISNPATSLTLSVSFSAALLLPRRPSKRSRSLHPIQAYPSSWRRSITQRRDARRLLNQPSSHISERQSRNLQNRDPLRYAAVQHCKPDQPASTCSQEDKSRNSGYTLRAQ